MAETSVALAILAAGRSRRFGAEDKLAAPFRGKMLGLHAADTLVGIDLAQRWIIADRQDHPCAGAWATAGYEVIENIHAAEGIGTSVALAARLADLAGADALLIALADMPMVSRGHVETLLTLATPQAMIASHDGTRPLPPALFGRAHFASLQRLSGDQGARSLLLDAKHVAADPATLVDIDTPEALQRHA